MRTKRQGGTVCLPGNTTKKFRVRNIVSRYFHKKCNVYCAHKCPRYIYKKILCKYFSLIRLNKINGSRNIFYAPPLIILIIN